MQNNSVGKQPFPLSFLTSRFSHSYLPLLKCCFLKRKQAALAWFHTEDLLCNCRSAVIITCFCCFSSQSHSLLDLSFSSHLSIFFLLPCPVFFAVSFPFPLSQTYSAHTLSETFLCDGCLTGGTDFTKTGCHHCKALLSWLMYGGNQCADKPLVMLRRKALTSSAACICFDSLITPNCRGGTFIPSCHIAALPACHCGESCHLCLAVARG